MMSATKSGHPDSELVIGLIGAIGTPLEEVADRISAGLEDYRFQTERIVVSEMLNDVRWRQSDIHLKTQPEAERIETHMKAGTSLRERTGRGDILAGFAVARIRQLRSQRKSDNVAFILRSLKRPEEVRTLRSVYRELFVAVGVWADRPNRVDHLARRLAHSAGEMKADAHRDRAEHLITKDEKELGTPLGQNVSDAFPEADYFINASEQGNALDRAIARLLKLIFGHPYVTPTRDEAAMFHAYAAALTSGALGRQVGAAIVSDIGDVLAVGMNEVPRAQGGHYWDGDDDDARDFQRHTDNNDQTKRDIARQILTHLRDKDWLKEQDNIDSLADDAMKEGGVFHQTWLANLTEFGRDVHAEMSAILSAARRGIALTGARLFCTTFPCHNCTKHILASGIREVIYVEPYTKSFALEFHQDAIQFGKSCGQKVSFIPFQGVAPRRHHSWFAMRKRKSNGKTVNWSPRQARIGDGTLDPGYIARELELVVSIQNSLETTVDIEINETMKNALAAARSELEKSPEWLQHVCKLNRRLNPQMKKHTAEDQTANKQEPEEDGRAVTDDLHSSAS